MKINLIDFGDNSYHFTINVKVNNIDATFLIDTGATNTVIFKRFYEENFDKEISLHVSDIAASASGESMETGSVTIDSIKIGNKEVSNFKIGCMNMEHIENIYKMVKEVAENISNDKNRTIFAFISAIIDSKLVEAALNKLSQFPL